MINRIRKVDLTEGLRDTSDQPFDAPVSAPTVRNLQQDRTVVVRSA